MKARGETAVRPGRRYGLPIHKEADAHEGPRQDIPLEDALWITPIRKASGSKPNPN